MTQVAGLSLGDLGPARLPGGPLVRRLLPSSPEALTRVSGPPATRGGARGPLLGSLRRFPRALPGSSPYLGAAKHFPDPAHTRQRAQRTRPPRCRPPSLQLPRARSPRIPLPTLIRAPSLARCPLHPGAGSPIAATRGSRDASRTSGHREPGNSSTKRASKRCSPGLARLPRLPRSHTHSGHSSLRRTRARGSPGGARRPRQSGIHALAPGRASPRPRPALRPSPGSDRGSLTHRCAPLRLPALSAVHERRAALTLAS